MNTEIERYILRQLIAYAQESSRDPSTKVAAMIYHPGHLDVLGVGINAFPPGHSEDPRWYADREYKLRHILHAESNALTACAGKSTRGCTAYVSFPSCPKCVELLSNAGIHRIVTPPLPTAGREPAWVEEWTARIEQAVALAQRLRITVDVLDV